MHGVAPHLDNSVELAERGLNRMQECEHVYGCHALPEALDDALARLLQEHSELSGAPALMRARHA